MFPAVKKAAFIRGSKLILRDVCSQDASFIISLRTNGRISRYLSRVSDNLSLQLAWLKEYEKNNNEAYFIIEDLSGLKMGLVRIYDACGTSFSWGSWVLSEDAPSFAAIESALIIYSYALYSLGFTQAHFQVVKANERVWRFHERCGAKRIAEDESQYHYVILNDEIKKSLEKYKRFLPDGIYTEEIK